MALISDLSGPVWVWKYFSSENISLTTHAEEVWGIEELSDVLVVDPEDAGVEELHDGRHRDEADQSQGFLLPLIGQVLTLQQSGALLLVRSGQILCSNL